MVFAGGGGRARHPLLDELAQARVVGHQREHAPVAAGREVLERQPSDPRLLDHVGVDVRQRLLVEGDHAARAERLQPRDDLGGKLRSGRDHADRMDPLAGPREAPRVCALEMDQRRIPELLERLDHRADGLRDGRPERPVRDLDQHDLGAAGPQGERDRVGLVPQALGDREHPVTGCRSDPVLLVGAVEDVADGGAGDAGAGGDVPGRRPLGVDHAPRFDLTHASSLRARSGVANDRRELALPGARADLPRERVYPPTLNWREVPITLP